MQLVWFVVGLVVMYWLDPTSGSSRRRLWLSRGWFVLRGLGGASRRRLRAFPSAPLASVAALRSRRAASIEALSEDELLERICDELDGVSHPQIAVHVESRRVTLSGPILAREVVTLLRRVAKVPGVETVSNHLSVKRDSDARVRWLPARRRRRRPDSVSAH